MADVSMLPKLAEIHERIGAELVHKAIIKYALASAKSISDEKIKLLNDSNCFTVTTPDCDISDPDTIDPIINVLASKLAHANKIALEVYKTNKDSAIQILVVTN